MTEERIQMILELFHPSWRSKIEPFIRSEEFEVIVNTLQQDKDRGKNVLPNGKRWFRCFLETDLNNLKVVFMGLSPYHQSGIADGLAFSCSLSMKEQPSLKLFLNGLEDDLGRELEEREVDLTRWCKEEGVLLTNIALCCQEQKADKYIDLWLPFWKFVYKEIFSLQNGLIFIYVGKEASKYSRYETPFIHYSKSVEHMAFAARQNREWYHENCFTWVNTILKSNNGPEFCIKWEKERVTLPF